MAYKGPKVVIGPTSVADNTVPRFDLTSGSLIKDSSVVISNSDEVSGVTQIDVGNIQINSNTISSTNTDGNIVLSPDGSGNITTGTASTANILNRLRSSSGQWDSFADGTDTFGLYNRAGDPEGSIAANIGSLCIDTTNGNIYIKKTDTVNTGWQIAGGGNQIVQMVTTELLTVASTSVTIPTDNSIPQNTEGALLLTRTITPSSTSNSLLFFFEAYSTTSTFDHGTTFALFEDSTANAEFACMTTSVTTGGQLPNSWHFIKTAPSTSSISYTVRFGPNAVINSYINANQTGTRLFGGVESARLTIFEVAI
jgi:hypothetical protein